MRSRHVLLLGLFLTAAFLCTAAGSSQAPGPATGTIEGRVLRYGTNEGVANVRIMLSGGPARGGAARGAAPAARGAAPSNAVTTDASGRFTIRDLAPGDYAIRAEHDAYIGIPSAGSVWAPSASSARATVTAGQASPEVRLYMLRAASISGRVRSRNGTPASGMTVTAYRRTYGSDGRLNFSAADETKTDERGEYRMFRLTPGQVWISASPPRLTASSRIPANLPVTTFYPNATNPLVASPASVSEGADLAGMDVTMQEQPALTIQGRLTNSLPGAPGAAGQPSGAASITFYLIPRETNPLSDGVTPIAAISSINRSSGQFEITGVTPGSYDLVAVSPLYAADGARTIFPESVRIDVGDKPVTGINVAIRPGSEVKARVLVDGVEGTAPSLTLRSLERYPIPFELAAALEVVRERSGVVTFKNVPRGRFVFEVRGLPPNAYVSDIRPGPAAYEDGFSVPSESGAVFDILVRTDGGAVRGFVRDSEGKAVSAATVVLAPGQPRRGNAALYKSARADASGSFAFTGVAPAEYKVFAWKDVPPNAWMNAEFMEGYEGFGKAVTAVGAAAVEADITLIAAATSR